MINLVSLLVAAALVSLQCEFVANAQIDNPKIELLDNLQPNVITTQQKRRSNVYIAESPPKTARLLPGSPLELTCKVLGSPAPMVHWLKNGEPISDFVESNEIPPVFTTTLAEMTGKLVIRSTASGDVYTCVATAGVLERIASTTVYTVGEDEDEDLLEKLLLMPSKPTITTYYNSVFQSMGTSIVLPCRADSYTKIQIFWHDPSNNVIYNNGHRRVLPSGDLFISDLVFSDMGNYTCTAQNMYGKETVESFLYTFKN